MSFGHSDANRMFSIPFESPLMALLFANWPQLFLSICYFTYNAMFTRLQVEEEWNSYGVSHKPLRVSFAASGQTSTYRLQLPYKYGIPLISLRLQMSHEWPPKNLFYAMILLYPYETPSEGPALKFYTQNNINLRLALKQVIICDITDATLQ